MEVALQLAKMSTVEKLRAMESLWDDLCQKTENVPSPSWHQKVLQNRVDDANKGIEHFTDWETAKKKIRNTVA